jgi:hypothetical protein
MATDTCTTGLCETHESHEKAETVRKQKAAIVVLSDPKSGSQEEALGRVFNALAAAYDFKQRGDDVSVLFQGAGTRWIGDRRYFVWLCRRIWRRRGSRSVGI